MTKKRICVDYVYGGENALVLYFIMAGLILALQFFTRVPLPISVEFSEKNMRHAFYALPWIGFLFGGITAFCMYFFSHKFIAAVLAILAVIVLGQSLHLDGLADCADAFFASANTDKTLEILKDPHIGTFGVIALILDIVLRVVLYSAFSFAPSLLILPPFLSRCFVLFAVVYGMPVKQNGLGAFFYRSISKYTPFVYFCFILFLCLSGVFFLQYHVLIFILPVLNLSIVFFMLKYCKKKLGGTTGDVNGAIVEILEIVNLFILLLFYTKGIC